MEESGMGDYAIHNLFPSHGRSPRAPAADRDHRDAQLAALVVTMVRAAATPPPAHSSRRTAEPVAARSMAPGRSVRRPGALDNGNSAPRPDASAATTTTSAPLRRCAQPPRPAAKTADEFRHNLAGLEPSAGFEGGQTAPRHLILAPLFWR